MLYKDHFTRQNEDDVRHALAEGDAEAEYNAWDALIDNLYMLHLPCPSRRLSDHGPFYMTPGNKCWTRKISAMTCSSNVSGLGDTFAVVW